MQRQNLLKMLNQYQPDNPDEIKTKDSIIDFIQKYENCFERSLVIGHITASAWLVDKANQKAFLMHHAKLNKWLQPGGHCDGDSNVLNVAIKEAKEESGISNIEPMMADIFDVDVHKIQANSKESEHYHYDIRFLLQVKTNEKGKKNHESHEIMWIEKNTTQSPPLEDSVKRLFNKWLKLK